MPWLVMFDGEMPLRVIDLAWEVTILGRGGLCDAVLEDHRDDISVNGFGRI
jgi:hypothetical protein